MNKKDLPKRGGPFCKKEGIMLLIQAFLRLEQALF